jgi:serine/threonine protein kinase
VTATARHTGAETISDALDRAHRLGIVLRDLEPANIMITRTGVKVLDFGLARLGRRIGFEPSAFITRIAPSTSA